MPFTTASWVHWQIDLIQDRDARNNKNVDPDIVHNEQIGVTTRTH